MTNNVAWIFIFLMLYWAYCLFWGVRASRCVETASDYFLAGRDLSPWVFALAATAISFAGWTFMGHPGLIFRDGFQFTNASFYAIAVAFSGVILLKRQWMLGRRYGYMTSGEMLTDYFKGNSLNLISVGIALLFGIPFVAILFGASGYLISELTDGDVSRNVAMWVLSGFVLLYSVIGGMQAVAKVAVVQCVLFFAGMVILGFYALDLVDGFDSLNIGLANMAKNVTGHLGTTNGLGGGDFSGYFASPGVIQWTSGLGIETPIGGPWTSVMVLTFMMSVMGIQASPCFSMIGFASRSPRGFAIHHIWGAACCVSILMLVFAIFQGAGAHLLGADADVNEAGLAIANLLPVVSDNQQGELVAHYIKLIGENLPWLIGFLAVCAVAALQATGAAFMSTTGSILTRDIYVRYLDTEAGHAKQMLVARLCTGLVFLAAMILASISMQATLLLGSLAVACAFQLWPSLLGVTWFPSITRGGATAGLVIGLIAVVLTEPLGQMLTGGTLPWGSWPWTIHSAAWGIFFNLIICLILSSRAGHDADHARRDSFHEFLHEYSVSSMRDRWSKPVAGVMVMIWMFFAIGPGSLLGNIVFGEPNAGYEAWTFGMPSLWAWQIIWWALGVGMIWFLANKMRMSTEPRLKIEHIDND